MMDSLNRKNKQQQQKRQFVPPLAVNQIGSAFNPSPNSQLLSLFAAQAATPVAANKKTLG